MMTTNGRRSVLMLGTSTTARQLASTLDELNLDVYFASTARDALKVLRGQRRDLLVVELTAVGLGEIGLTDLAAAAQARGIRLALLTSRSVAEVDACASILGAVASLNKRASIDVTARRLSDLAIQAPVLPAEFKRESIGWRARPAYSAA
jgi:ActR/RegA family two-component response regulator